MSTEPLSDRPQKPRFRFRALLNISMGVLYLVLAGAIITFKKFGTIDLTAGYSAFLLGGLLALYGIFRIWRAIQDMKNSNYADTDN